MVNILWVIIALILLFATDVLTLIPGRVGGNYLRYWGNLINVRQLKRFGARIKRSAPLRSGHDIGCAAGRSRALRSLFWVLVERLRREYRPPDAVLLRDGIIADWAEDRPDASHNTAPPDGVIIYHFDGALFLKRHLLCQTHPAGHKEG